MTHMFEKDFEDPVSDKRLKIRVLVAEDNIHNREHIVKILFPYGYVIDLAQNGREVLELVYGPF